MIHDQSLTDILRTFADASTTHAVGPAAAVSGAVGASLLAKIAALPRLRVDAPADARAALDAARAALLEHQRALLALADRDAAADAGVATAGDDAAARQQALVAATEVLVDIVRTCARALQDARPIGEFGDPAALTDLVGGVNGLATAVQSAWLSAIDHMDHVEDAAAADRLLADITAEMSSGYRELPPLYKASGVIQLMMRASERTGLPHGAPKDPKDRRTMTARGVALGLRRLGTPEARAALEALDRSDDADIKRATSDALQQWGTPLEPGP